MITIIVTSLFTFTLTYATDQDTPVIEDPVANYVYAIQASADIGISSGTAIATARIYTSSKSNSIDLTLKLQKKSASSWSTVKTWTASSNNTSLHLSKSKAISQGTYRVYAKFTISGNSGSEVIRAYSEQATR